MIISGSDVSDGGHFDIGHKAACTGFPIVQKYLMVSDTTGGTRLSWLTKDPYDVTCEACMESWQFIEARAEADNDPLT